MRWDVHNHAVPREAVELLREGDGYPIKVEGDFMEADRVRAELTPVFTDPAVKLEQLAEVGLDAAAVSVSPALFAYETDEERGAALCGAVNAGLADLCAFDPERLRWLAHVPLQAPQAAAELLTEAAQAGAVGAQIGTSVAGTPLADAGLDPLWATAADRDLPLMLHPAYNNAHPGLEGFHLQNAVGNQLETTIAAERLIVTGALDRHPGLRLLLVHAGGYIPWQGGRLRHAATVRPELAGAPPDPHDYWGRIFVDPITHDAAALRYLVGRVGPDNVAMGTDLPFDMATPDPVAALEEAVGEDAARRIMEDTPRRLFGL
ncbi:MAG TPA: amidohydrolase family protein [Thermoleophilaceae bacterium]|nr:amidohydrolase family protein [Thermoleophilaceae bacterium]